MYLSFPCLPNLRIYANNSKCYATVSCVTLSQMLCQLHMMIIHNCHKNFNPEKEMTTNNFSKESFHFTDHGKRVCS